MTRFRGWVLQAAGCGLAVAVWMPSSPSAQRAQQEPDIGQKTQVTSDKTLETTPAWDGSGQSLTFTCDRFGGIGLCRIGRTGGGGVAALTEPGLGEVDTYPDVSRADGQIAFASNRSRGMFQIWSIAVGARGLTQLTQTQYGASFPAWSPDGREIAYTALDRNGTAYIWVMESNGANQRQLTAGTHPRWAPDGKRLVFSGFGGTNSRNRDIFTIDITTSTRTQITSDTTAEFQPDWSPDGRWISYVSYKGTIAFLKSGQQVIKDLRSKANYEIWIKDVAGPAAPGIQLTRSNGFDGWPRWAPKTSELAFASDRGGTLDLWTMVPGVASRPVPAP